MSAINVHFESALFGNESLIIDWFTFATKTCLSINISISVRVFVMCGHIIFDIQKSSQILHKTRNYFIIRVRSEDFQPEIIFRAELDLSNILYKKLRKST